MSSAPPRLPPSIISVIASTTSPDSFQAKLVKQLIIIQAVLTTVAMGLFSWYGFQFDQTIYILVISILPANLASIWAIWNLYRWNNFRVTGIVLDANLATLFFVLLITGVRPPNLVFYIWVMLTAAITIDRRIVRRTGIVILLSILIGGLAELLVDIVPLLPYAESVPTWVEPATILIGIWMILIMIWRFVDAVIDMQRAATVYIHQITQTLQQAADHYMLTSTQQSNSVDQITNTMFRLSNINTQIFRLIDNLNADAMAAQLRVQRALEDAQRVVEAIASVRRRNEALAQQVQGMQVISDDIDGALKIIKDFTNQTQLLALNARIEAAGAGDYGRRFGVVANQIKQLAEEALNVTSEIRDLVERAQTQIAPAVTAAGDTATYADEGARITATYRQLMKDLASGTVNNVARIAEIRQATEEQQDVSDQLISAMDEARLLVDQLTDYGQRIHFVAEQLAKLQNGNT